MIGWRRWAFTLGIVLAWTVPAAAEDSLECTRDTIRQISSIGVFVVTASGHVYDVLGQDTIDPDQWRIGEDLIICRDSHGKELFDVKNLDRNETLVTSREPFLLH